MNSIGFCLDPEKTPQSTYLPRHSYNAPCFFNELSTAALISSYGSPISPFALFCSFNSFPALSAPLCTRKRSINARKSPCSSFSSPAFRKSTDFWCVTGNFDPVRSSTTAINSFCDKLNDAVARYWFAVSSACARIPATALPICARVLACHFSSPESITVAVLSLRLTIPRPVRSRPCCRY